MSKSFPAVGSSTPATGVNHSGRTDPVWYAAADVPSYAELSQDVAADVCIIGAGIAGLTCAYLLAKAGKSVVVVDMKPIAGGETGRTSAHLASAIDDRFIEIERLHGYDGARIQYESHSAAIDLIERIVEDEAVSCDFRRIDGYLFLPPGESTTLLERELEAAHRAGFHDVQRLADSSRRGTTTGPCLRFPRQARIQVVRYLSGLARKLAQMGVRIYTGSRIVELTGGEQTIATTQRGHKITASAAIAATNIPTPINNWAGIYTKIAPYRSYMIGLRLPKGSVDDALYWDTIDPYHYARVDTSAGNGDHDVLIVGGEDHKTGQHTSAIEERERFARLEEWTRRQFPTAGEALYRWTGQVNEPDDGVAFIGKVPTSGMDNIYTITGDSGMGLTHGTLGAILISDLIQGKTNRWADLYDPARKRLLASTEWLRENLNAAAQYADYVTPGEVASVDDIRPGSGAVMRRGFSKVAIYRDPDGALHECSALCTHLKGIVHWNDVEKSWDCPVHGSRFDCHGKLVTGPAIDDLGNTE